MLYLNLWRERLRYFLKNFKKTSLSSHPIDKIRQELKIHYTNGGLGVVELFK
jgi:hypothetical protein